MQSKTMDFLKKESRILVSALIAFLVAISLPSFQLFENQAAGMLQSHLLLELFATLVALLIAVVSWHDLENSKNPKSGIMMAGFLAIACMDLVHALTYDGMPKLITESSTSKAILFWLAGRTLMIATLLMYLFGNLRALSRWFWLAASLSIVAAIFWLGTFRLDRLPELFIPGEGVTAFKRYYEYGLFFADLILATAFIYKANADTQRQYFSLAASCLVMAMGEIIFSNYKAPSDFLNSFGHVFKILSYALLYQSVFVSAVRLPYQQARQSESRFKDLTELSADGFWELDKSLCFSSISPGLPTLLALRMLGHSPWDLPIVSKIAADWAHHQELLRSHRKFKEFQFQLEISPGVSRWFSSSGSPVFDERGEFQGYRGVMTDISDRKAAEARIEELAYHDPLTGLPNRLLIEDRFLQAKAFATQSNSRLALLFLDLDGFKSINDSLGHDTGDRFLVEISRRLLAGVRELDTVGRPGGDEFLILLSGLHDVDDTLSFLTGILGAVQQPFRAGSHEISSTASIGVAVFPDDGASFEELRRKADMAMYRAKSAGRNAFRFFDATMNTESSEHLTIYNGLRRAIEHEEFVLHYQPQFDLLSRKMTGVEALVRWMHPEMGLLPPGRFIHVAEESGLIIDIGEWVLKASCHQAMAWQRLGLLDFTIAVNLSGAQFKRGDLEKTVIAALQESGLPAERLELELTESILIQNVDGALGGISKLKKLGVQLSIDDFGTGYSSLAYLKHFDIDKLKIDQSFVRDLGADANNAAIVMAIIQMARSLNLKTVAEGVETREMADQLRGYGCDEGQGYYFARPMPAEALSAFLQEATAIE